LTDRNSKKATTLLRKFFEVFIFFYFIYFIFYWFF